jgi:hypothetical protein
VGRSGEGEGNGKDAEVEEDGSALHITYEDRIMKPSKRCEKEGKWEGDGNIM